MGEASKMGRDGQGRAAKDRAIARDESEMRSRARVGGWGGASTFSTCSMTPSSVRSSFLIVASIESTSVVVLTAVGAAAESAEALSKVSMPCWSDSEFTTADTYGEGGGWAEAGWVGC